MNMLSLRDYQRIEQALYFLCEQHPRQPTLAETAAQVHLSEAHFQRLFSRWVGISPKRFLQFLNKESLKAGLARGQSIMEASLDSGLSSTSRAHDLFLSIEGMTPAQYRRQGKDLLLRYGIHPSPFGDCLLASSERGLCHLAFVQDSAEQAMHELQTAWAEATLIYDPQATADIIQRIFTPDRQDSTPLHLLLRGTNFQLKVWEALLQIPQGEVSSYEGLAQRCAAPTATRAVASAVARNQVAWLIPCHRVIRKLGESGEYRWGARRKRLILAWEDYQRLRK